MPDRFLSSEEYDEQAHKLYNDGDYEGALEMLKEGLSLYPNAVELYVGLGYARLAREEYAWARKAFEQAVVLDASHEDALVGLGETLLRFGEKEHALKLFEEAGQDHEEFKLKLQKDLDVELAEIDVHRKIAEQQAVVVGEALKSANIDIVGGETEFFDRITNAITTGKVVDRTVGNSRVLEDVKDTFFNGDPEYFQSQMTTWLTDFGVKSEDLKNLSVSALLAKLVGKSKGKDRERLVGLLGAAERFGLADAKAAEVLNKLG